MDWGGYGTFKELLKTAIPEIQIIDLPPGTVVPEGYSYPLVEAENDRESSLGGIPEGVPALVYRLRKHDTKTPAVPSERLKILLDAVEQATARSVWEELNIDPGKMGIWELNQLTKYGRDLTVGQELAPPRAHLDYMLKALFFSRNLRPDLDKKSIGSIVEGWFFARASKFGLVVDAVSDRDEVTNWIEAALQ